MKRGAIKRPVRPTFVWNDVPEPVVNGLYELARIFPASDGDGKKYPAHLQHLPLMMELVKLSLANIEIVSPLIRAMIRYCQAEGINQQQYLASQIEMKFRRKIHKKSLRKS